MLITEVQGLCSPYSAPLAILQRFTQRGANLLGKKRRGKTHIGIIDINFEGFEFTKVKDRIDMVDAWMKGRRDFSPWSHFARDEIEQFGLLTGNIGIIKIRFNGVVEKEWNMAEEVAGRRRTAGTRADVRP